MRDHNSPGLGHFSLVLHAHAPYVLAYGQWPGGTEVICEAAAKSYIPLLNALNRLVSDNLEPQITLSLSPVVCEMLAALAFVPDFQNYLQNHIDRAAATQREFAAQGFEDQRDLALFWENWYTNIARDFDQKYNCDIVGAFRQLQDGGHIEIMAGPATHAYLPLLSTDEAIQAQLKIGIDTYKRHFGRAPLGLWLPECAYRPAGVWQGEGSAPEFRPGLEEFLADNDIGYFVIDTHQLVGGAAGGNYTLHHPALRFARDVAGTEARGTETENADCTPFRAHFVSPGPGCTPSVACFTRHAATTAALESAAGYPTNNYYLDVRKQHFPGGHLLWRGTGMDVDLAAKELYEPFRTAEIAAAQAEDFVGIVKAELQGYQAATGEAGVVCAAFDLDLFGRCWFEGHSWLYRVLKKIVQDEALAAVTCGAFLEDNPPTGVVTVREGSWGDGGGHRIWLNEDTAWTWREIAECEKTMTSLVERLGGSRNPKLRQILEQCGRELLLLQSSEWQFGIATVTGRAYGALRCAGHISTFRTLAAMAEKVETGAFMTEGEREFLQAAMQRDACFKEIPTRLWAGLETVAGS